MPINAPGDAYEQGADSVVKAVTSKPQLPPSSDRKSKKTRNECLKIWTKPSHPAIIVAEMSVKNGEIEISFDQPKRE